MSHQLKHLYEFGLFRLDAGERLLLRDGESVPLTPKSFDLLLALVEHHGRLLEKDELLKKVWPDTFVEETNLSYNISLIRKALGDGENGQKFIETVPRRGYRFVAGVRQIQSAPVEEEPPIAMPVAEPLSPTMPPAAPERSGQWRRLALALTGSGTIIIAIVAWFYFNRAPVLTEKDTILLADFENKTGEEIFDKMLKQALAIQLQQSPFLNLLSEAQMRHELKLMRRSSDERVTAEIAREICERQNLKALIAGSIAPLGSHYVITLEAISARSGESLAREQIEAESKEKVLQGLSQAATRLRERLGESLVSIQRFNKPLEEITTAKLEAFKFYFQGVELAVGGGLMDAIPYLERAVEIDPEFVSAYTLLSVMYGRTDRLRLAAEYAEKGYTLKDKVSEYERLRLDYWYHNFVTGNLHKGIEALMLQKRIHPRASSGPNDLSLAYNLIGQYDQAIVEARESIRLNPIFASPYKNQGLGLLRLNRFADAGNVLSQAVEQKLEMTEFHSLLYQIAFINNDPAGMQRQIDWARGKPDEHIAFDWQAGAAAFPGQWRKARDLSRRAIGLAARGDTQEIAARYGAEQALRGAVFGDCRQAGIDAAQGLKFTRSRISLSRAALALALCGAANQARPLDGELTKRYPEDTIINSIWLPAIRAAMELQRDNAAQAIEQLQTTSRYEAAAEFWPQYLRGHAYLKLKRGAEAAAEFQQILDHRGYAPLSPLYPLAHLGLARAAALTGAMARSRKDCEAFFAAWKEADADLPILREARREYELMAKR